MIIGSHLTLEIGKRYGNEEDLTSDAGADPHPLVFIVQRTATYREYLDQCETLCGVGYQPCPEGFNFYFVITD